MAKDRSKYFREYSRERMKNPLLRERHYQTCKESRDRQTPDQRERRRVMVRAAYCARQEKVSPGKASQIAQKAAKIKARRIKVCELRKMGATIQQVSEMLGVSIATVNRDSTTC